MHKHRFMLSLLASVATLSGGFAAPFAEASPPAAEWKAQLPGVYRFRLGDFQISVLSDGSVPQDLHALLTRTTPAEVDKLLQRSFLKNPVEASINAYLIDTGSRLVLVETGAGLLFGPGLGGKLIASLAAAGYRPEQINDILITHIHADHSGGLVDATGMVFPNATVHVGKADVDFFLNPANIGAGGYDRKYFDGAVKTVGPYMRAGKVKPFTSAGEILPGITAIPTPGHTPGHSFYLIESQGQQLEVWGDILHFAAVQFPKPSVTIVYDVDPSAAAAQRAKQFSLAATQRKLVAGTHLPYPGIGHVRAEGSGYIWVPIDYFDRDNR
ncbi:MBL fold metallo-hydrolase [Hyalangium versicolor]|uniref:MBL fold metallo-hydrolase n=1 Tax=Hyalangium versicolor TaxID=2861190 RepID=UPI001CCB0CD9|nr:MBL fold metallo-hydrolase [Hyalangium versicolor]